MSLTNTIGIFCKIVKRPLCFHPSQKTFLQHIFNEKLFYRPLVSTKPALMHTFTLVEVFTCVQVQFRRRDF